MTFRGQCSINAINSNRHLYHLQCKPRNQSVCYGLLSWEASAICNLPHEQLIQEETCTWKNQFQHGMVGITVQLWPGFLLKRRRWRIAVLVWCTTCRKQKGRSVWFGWCLYETGEVRIQGIFYQLHLLIPELFLMERFTALPKPHISVVPDNCQGNSLNNSYFLLSSHDSHSLG